MPLPSSLRKATRQKYNRSDPFNLGCPVIGPSGTAFVTLLRCSSTRSQTRLTLFSPNRTCLHMAEGAEKLGFHWLSSHFKHLAKGKYQPRQVQPTGEGNLGPRQNHPPCLRELSCGGLDTNRAEKVCMRYSCEVQKMNIQIGHLEGRTVTTPSSPAETRLVFRCSESKWQPRQRF